MNERIKELLSEAKIYDGSTTQNITTCPSDLEKFAELIVRECISTLEEKIHRSIDNEGDEVWIDLLLKEHFGVEE
jgi:hypothetical protein